MSPSAPDPALSRCSRQTSGNGRVHDPVLQVLRSHMPDLTQPSLGDQLPCEGESRHPAIVEARPSTGRPCFATRSATSVIATASSTVLASGFSQSTCLPASSAAMAISACVSPGVHTSTSWTSSRAMSARQSVSTLPQPRRRAASARRLGVASRRERPSRGERQVEEPTGRTPRLRVRRPHEGVAHHADAEHRRALLSVIRQDGKASGRYWSTFSLVTVALARVMDAGTSSSTRSLMPLLLAMSRARLMADAAMLGG